MKAIVLVLFFCVIFQVSCSASSGFKPITKDLHVKTNPPGASVKIGNVTKKSPAVFKDLRRTKKKFHVQISKEGYMPIHPWPKGTASSVNIDLVKLEDAKNKAVGIKFYKLSIVPKEIYPGSQFGFSAKYRVFNNTIVDEFVPITLTFAILDNRKVLYKDSKTLSVPQSKDYVTEKTDLRAGRKPGRYELQVWLKYKDKEYTRFVPLEVK